MFLEREAEKVAAARDFKNKIVEHFEQTTKTGWGKKEVVKMIEGLWTAHLEEIISSK